MYGYFMLPLALLEEEKLMRLLPEFELQMILMHTLGAYFW